jgi:hypothetical protein
VRISRTKVVALLAYLAVTGTPHNRDALATLLWPERSQSRARAYLRRALSELNRTLLPVTSLILAGQGKPGRAVEIYALASRYPYVANSHWFEDVVGKHITAVAATLPPEVVGAAQERGRARDLWETAQELLEELDRADTEG